MSITRFYALMLVVTVASFLGFCVENFFIYFNHGFIDNRNMVLPFLFGYGLAILGIYGLFGTPDNPLFLGNPIFAGRQALGIIFYFSISFLCVSLGELILGHLVEWLCGIVWWDYSAIPLHLTRYTSLPTSAGFALLITVFMKYFFHSMLNYFSSINFKVLSFFAIFLCLALSIDMINSAIYMFRNHDTLHIWKYDLNAPLKEYFSRSNDKI